MISLNDDERCVLVDFGLAKRYIGKDGNLVPERESAEFRGTSIYAPLSSHNRKVRVWFLIAAANTSAFPFPGPWPRGRLVVPLLLRRFYDTRRSSVAQVRQKR